VNEVRHVVDFPFAGRRRECRQTKQTFASRFTISARCPLLNRGDKLGAGCASLLRARRISSSRPVRRRDPRAMKVLLSARGE
jgi:hypothetical protein